MGGKKPIGAAPSRGHHHNTAHSGHRVWSTPQFSYWGSSSESLWQPNNPASPPPLSSFAPQDRSVEALEKRIVELSSELESVKGSLSNSSSGNIADETLYQLTAFSEPSLRLATNNSPKVDYEDEAREGDFPRPLSQVALSNRINPLPTTDYLMMRIEAMEVSKALCFKMCMFRTSTPLFFGVLGRHTTFNEK